MSSVHIDNQYRNDSVPLNESAHLHPSATNASDPLASSETMMPKMDDMMDILKISCSTAVIFGGLIPYIPQYVKIKKSRSSEGFSTYGTLTESIADVSQNQGHTRLIQ